MSLLKPDTAESRSLGGRLFALGMAVLAGSAAWACPDGQLEPLETHVLSGAQLIEGRDYPAVAGGATHLRECPGYFAITEQAGGGWFASRPDFAFALEGLEGHRLVISVRSECDTQLLVSGGSVDNYFDDDDNGNLDPRIVLPRVPAQVLNVWIGSYEPDYCTAMLHLQAVPE